MKKKEKAKPAKPPKKKPKVVPADRTTFEDGWVEFSPFTHSEKNAKLLAEYGMEPPKAKGYYDY